MPELSAESTSSASSPASSSPTTPTSAAPVRDLVNKVATLSAGAMAYVPPSVSEKVAQFGSPLVDAADSQIRAARAAVAAASERFQATQASTSEAVSARVEVALAAVKQSMETLQTTISQFRPAAKAGDASSSSDAAADGDAPKSAVQVKMAELQVQFAAAMEKARELRDTSTQKVLDLYASAIAATTSATANAQAMTNAQAQLALAKVAELQAKIQELVKSLTAKKDSAASAQGEGAAAVAAQ